LRINRIDVLLVLTQKCSDVSKRATDALSEQPNGFGLLLSYFAKNALGLAKDAMIQIVPTLAVVVSNLVDLRD